MTVIVGVADRGTVWLGGDSCVSAEDFTERVEGGKVFRRGDLLIGSSWSLRASQVVRHEMEVPKYQGSMSPIQYMVRKFIPELRSSLSGSGCLKNESGELRTQFTMCVGLHGSIFTIHQDFCVCQSDTGYMAIGSGRDFAIGSLATTQNMRIIAKKRVELAMLAAAEHSGSVAGPFRILSLKSSL